MTGGIIDMSSDNTQDLDAALVSQYSLVAVIHRATTGATGQDSMYATRRAQAKTLGLLWGAYHFGTHAPVDQQIANFVNLASPGATDLVALDYEEFTGDESDTMTQQDAEGFVNGYEQKEGYKPLLYGSNFLTEIKAPSVLTSCRLWIAQYTSASSPKLPPLWSDWTLWQYVGTVMDQDRFNGTAAELTRQWPLR